MSLKRLESDFTLWWVGVSQKRLESDSTTTVCVLKNLVELRIPKKRLTFLQYKFACGYGLLYYATLSCARQFYSSRGECLMVYQTNFQCIVITL